MGGRCASSGRATSRGMNAGTRSTTQAQNRDLLINAQFDNSVLSNLKTTKINSVNTQTVQFKDSSLDWYAPPIGDSISVVKGGSRIVISQSPRATGKQWYLREDLIHVGTSYRIAESDSVDELVKKANKRLKYRR